MGMESSSEIEKFFNQEVARQKRIGSNVHKRKGKGVKNGISGGIRFAKNNFKKYEKNSRVSNANIYEDVLKYDEFASLSDQKQKEYLIEWRKRYTDEEIYTIMGIYSSKYYNIIYKFNIKKKIGETVRVDKNRILEYKEKINPEEFKKLPDDQKFEVLDHYQKNKGMTNREMADMLGYETNTFTSYKTRWKKAYSAREDQAMGKHRDRDSYLIVSEENEYEDTNQNNGQEVKEEKIEEYHKSNNTNIETKEDQSRILESQFNIKFSDMYKVTDIKTKMDAITNLLDQNKRYKVTVSIEEIKE